MKFIEEHWWVIVAIIILWTMANATQGQPLFTGFGIGGTGQLGGSTTGNF